MVSDSTSASQSLDCSIPPSPAWLLGIETSGRSGSIALLRGADLVAEHSLEPSGRRHAQTLVQDVVAMLRSEGLRPADVPDVAVSIGPGSFTGLRVGVVFAKTWAWAARGRLVAVDTLQAVAEQSPTSVDRVWVLSDAQRDDLYLARYRRIDRSDEFVREGEIRIEPVERWLKGLSPQDVVSGPGAGKLDELAPRRVMLLDAAVREPRAGTVARIGARELARGRTADPRLLEPFYLRRPAAEEKRIASEAGDPPV